MEEGEGEGTMGRQTPHVNVAGRSRLPAWLARASLLLMSSSEWEGNGVSPNARASLFWYHRGGRYPGDSVMWQLQPIRPKCVWLYVRHCHCIDHGPLYYYYYRGPCIDRLVGGSRYSLPSYMRVTNFCYIFGRRNGGRLIREYIR